MTSLLGAGSITCVLATAAGRYGLDAEQLLTDAGLHPDEVRDPSALVPTAAYEHILRSVLRQTGDEAFGLRAAEDFDLRSQGFWGYALLSATTLRERLERNIRYQPLRAPIEISLREEGALAVVDIALHGLALDLAPVTIDLTAACGCLQLFRHMRVKPRGLSVRFSQRERPHHRWLRERLPGEMFFGAERDRVSFAACDLDLPLAGDPYLGELAASQLEEQLAAREVENPSPVLDRVRRRIAARLQDDASLERVARDLKVSVRTLQRMLDANGASFHELTTEVRRSRALEYLTDTNEPVEMIAERLGYGDASTFRRAFRRWMGCAPAVYRAEQRAANGAVQDLRTVEGRAS